jgi:hypothetical protein
MQLSLRYLFASAGLLMLSSCGNEEPPAPRYPPYTSYSSELETPPASQTDISPPPAPQPPAPVAPGSFPTAQRTANADQVLSPYEPYNVIDITGFASGQLARDPSNQKIFRIP